MPHYPVWIGDCGWCDLLGEHFDLDIALYTKDA
jgi:hypothetical protein